MQRVTSAKNKKSYDGRAIIFVGVFCVIGVCAQSYLKTETVTKMPVYVAEFDTVKLPIPEEVVNIGTPAERILLRETSYPKHQLPEGAVLTVDELRGMESAVTLPAGVPLFRKNFVIAGSSINPVIESIPAGMRAMTIKVDATSAVEGWAGSGSLVDVLLVEKDQTLVVAENVKILSSERSVAPVDGQVSPSIPSTVTLLVSQEQCLKINTAIPRGRIAFALRSFNDNQNWNRTIYTADKLNQKPSTSLVASEITGYLEVKDANTSKQYAFTEGKWIKTQTKPAGFFVDG